MGQILPQPTGASQKPYETSVTGRGNEPGSALRFLSALWRCILCGNNNISQSGSLPKFHQILPRPPKLHQILDLQRLPLRATLQLHQILQAPRKDSILFSSLSTLLFFSLLFSFPSILHSSILYSFLFYFLLFDSFLFYSFLFPSILDSAILFSSILSPLLFFSLLFSTLLCLTLLFFTLLFFII